MDIPRPETLKQLQLSLTSEGKQLAYYLSDMSSGKIVSVPRDAALGLRRMQDRVEGRVASEIARDDLEAGLKAIGYVRSLRRADRAKAAKFNPLFVQIPLFDVGPWQPRLQRFASWFVGLPLALLVLSLIIIVLLLGIRNDWAIRSEFADVLRLETLLTFGLIAPFLKIIHEFGHVLAATAVNVRVRMAAISLIALYPLPSVDCSEADVAASRAGRVAISLAGIITDLIIGLIAFILWHVAESGATRAVAGQVVVFSTLNSLIFNANPLMKLDGYYAAVDLLGQRNLYTRASARFVELSRYLFSLGALGQRPEGLGGIGLVSYGAATFVYRIMISFMIVTAILPQYLGLGMVLGAWGVYVMFVSPLLADPIPKSESKAPRWRVWSGRGGFLAVASAIVLFLPLPFTLWLPLRLDDAGFYAVTVQATGFASGKPRSAGIAEAGQILLLMESPELVRRSQILDMERREADLLLQNTQSVGLAEAQLAQEKMRSVEAQIAVLEIERRNLVVISGEAGYFVASGGLAQGQMLNAGDTFGHLYPQTGDAHLVGAFPERLVEEYQTHPPHGEVRIGDQYIVVNMTEMTLTDGAITDPSTGLRSIRLHLELPVEPSVLVGQDIQIRLHFGNRPIWDHLAFWVAGKLAAFRDAQIADRQSRIQPLN
ncbi:MAG: site-2 protease family protein [Paracoccaceae bacterium]